MPEIPAGDVLLPLERLMLGVRSGVSSITGVLRVNRERLQRTAAAVRDNAWALIQSTSRAEVLLNRWRVAVTLALLVGAALAWLAV